MRNASAASQTSEKGITAKKGILQARRKTRVSTGGMGEGSSRTVGGEGRDEKKTQKTGESRGDRRAWRPLLGRGGANETSPRVKGESSTAFQVGGGDKKHMNTEKDIGGKGGDEKRT